MLAMSELGADCYALYSQTSIIILTLAWTIYFKTRLSGTCWCGILMIALGMVGFNLSDDKSSTLGLAYIFFKIVTQSFACLYAEAFIKRDPEQLYIQMAWIKPVELLTTGLMMFVIPAFERLVGAKSYDEPTPWMNIMGKGYFHDWDALVVFIMVFNMGDTFMTATVAKQFDSVVKGVAGVADIIYPTQVLIQFINPPTYTQLQVISAGTIILGSLNFVLAKGDMKQFESRDQEIISLKAAVKSYECDAA